MDLYFGTAGYSYPAWVGPFYPPGTPGAGFLAEYARHFPAVEINSSFHRPPTAEQVTRMARRVPPGFGFTLKVPRTASHDRSPADLPAFRSAADRLAGLGQLLGLLVQVAESYHDTPANRAWLGEIATALRPHRLAVEFRHQSWDGADLPAWTAGAGLDVVSVGVPAIPTLFPAGPRVSNRRVYARLHSQNAASWYAGGPARYDYDYPDPVIRKWAAALAGLAARDEADVGLVFFNNCVGVQAVENARKLAAMLAETAPAVRVVPPPPSARPTLFDL
ncbi:MAG TPA: DUF72 domain-containing protein [Urbifossiella sp.]|jgi:uncharacterized protein YecE (DUF72 family)|nr:DUF72 domain-containing protein [Urbifossiella sp.]